MTKKEKLIIEKLTIGQDFKKLQMNEIIFLIEAVAAYRKGIRQITKAAKDADKRVQTLAGEK